MLGGDPCGRVFKGSGGGRVVVLRCLITSAAREASGDVVENVSE